MFDTYSIFIKWSIDCAMKWYHVAGKHGMCHFKLKWHRHTIQNRESSYCICLRVHVCVCVCMRVWERKRDLGRREWEEAWGSRTLEYTHPHSASVSMNGHSAEARSMKTSQKRENRGVGLGVKGVKDGVWCQKKHGRLFSPAPHVPTKTSGKYSMNEYSFGELHFNFSLQQRR